MATKINFSYNDRDYCLEYTRETVKSMEAKGFAVERVLEAPLTMLPELFAGAFKAHHEFTNRKKIDEMFYSMKDRQALLNTLVTMYREPLNELMSDSEDGEGNTIAWEKTN